MHEKFIELEAKQKNYEDKVRIDVDQRLEEYETHMEKFSVGLKELKEIRNLIDPTIEEEIERINQIYELKLENTINKTERLNKQVSENKKSLDEILDKYQVEIEVMKNNFLNTAELQNKRIQGAFDEQNDVLEAFNGDIKALEDKFKSFHTDYIESTDSSMKNLNQMVVDTKKVMDRYKTQIDTKLDDWDVARHRSELELESKVTHLHRQSLLVETVYIGSVESS